MQSPQRRDTCQFPEVVVAVGVVVNTVVVGVVVDVVLVHGLLIVPPPAVHWYEHIVPLFERGTASERLGCNRIYSTTFGAVVAWVKYRRRSRN